MIGTRLTLLALALTLGACGTVQQADVGASPASAPVAASHYVDVYTIGKVVNCACGNSARQAAIGYLVK